MGIDAVGLVIAIEDMFGISIADEDYEYLKTVGDMHQFILCQLEAQRRLQTVRPACPSVSAFLATRKAVMSLVNVERNAIRPKTKLADIFPKATRQIVWEQLHVLMHTRLPPLAVPPRSRRLLFLLWLGLPIAVLSISYVAIGKIGLVLAIPVYFGVLIAMYFTTRPLAFAFPDKVATIADVVRVARTPPFPPLHPPTTTAEADVVWDKLVRIIVDELRVPAEDVVPTATFVEDLKAY